MAEGSAGVPCYGMEQKTQTIGEQWFPVLITGCSTVANVTYYSWVHRWLLANGTLGNMPGTAEGNATGNVSNSTFAGVAMGNVTLSAGSLALARPAMGAGGSLYELVPASASSPPPPPPPSPPPASAGAGWGMVAGLNANHCFKATITAGNSSGKSSSVPANQTILLNYSGGTWNSLTNLNYGSGSGALTLAITNGQPQLTMGGYSFSYDGTTSYGSPVSGNYTDAILFRGALGNGTEQANFPGVWPYYPTAVINTFGIQLALDVCTQVVCCSNITLPRKLNATITGDPIFSGSYELYYYSDGGGSVLDGKWLAIIGNETQPYIMYYNCDFQIINVVEYKSVIIANAAAGNLSNLYYSSSVYSGIRNESGNTSLNCDPYVYTSDIALSAGASGPPGSGFLTITL